MEFNPEAKADCLVNGVVHGTDSDTNAIQKVKENLLADYKGAIPNNHMPYDTLQQPHSSSLGPGNFASNKNEDMQDLEGRMDFEEQSSNGHINSDSNTIYNGNSMQPSSTVPNYVISNSPMHAQTIEDISDDDNGDEIMPDIYDPSETIQAEPSKPQEDVSEIPEQPTVMANEMDCTVAGDDGVDDEPEVIEKTVKEDNDFDNVHPETSTGPEVIYEEEVSATEKDVTEPETVSKDDADLNKADTKLPEIEVANSQSQVAKVARNESESDDIQCLEYVEKKKKTSVEEVAEAPVTADSLRQQLGKMLENADKRPIGETKVVDEITKFLIKENLKNPEAIRKILGTKELLFPTAVILPPSQVVELMAEYEPEKSLGMLLSQVFEGPPPETQQERGHKNTFKMRYPAPHMTRQLYDIGLQLAQESTYTDIVNMKNLPEKPKNPETYKQVVSQVKPVLEMLNRHMAAFKLQLTKCHLCDFKTESKNALVNHLQYPHNKYGKWYCGFCPFYTLDENKIKSHSKMEHGYEALFMAPFQKAPCTLCDEEFAFKGVLQAHYKACKLQALQNRNQCMKPTSSDIPMVNNWLWPQPVDGQNGIPGGVKVTQERYGGALRVKGDVNSSDPFMRNATVIKAAPPQMRYNQPPVKSYNWADRQNNQNYPYLGRPNSNNMVRPHNLVRPPLVRAPVVSAGPRFATAVMAQPVKCEICDIPCDNRLHLLTHFQRYHGRLIGKSMKDMTGGAPLACSRCRDRFWTYEGLERHLLMAHCLVTNDLLAKAQNKSDSGRCKVCDKQYAFNLLQHLVVDHKQKLCSAEILYSCDVCTYQCTSYTDLDKHLVEKHNTGQTNRPVKRPANYTPPGQPPARKSANVGYNKYSSAPKLTPSSGSQFKTAPKVAQVAKKVRYTCTPCALKFEQYKDVILHWQLRHLAKITITCDRIDSENSKQKLLDMNGNIKVDWTFPDLTETPNNPDVICIE